MTVERIEDILKKHIVVKTEGKGLVWHVKNVLSGGVLRREEKQLRREVVEMLLDDAVSLGRYGITTGEYSRYMDTHRRGVVTGYIDEKGHQLLEDISHAIESTSTRDLIVR